MKKETKIKLAKLLREARRPKPSALVTTKEIALDFSSLEKKLDQNERASKEIRQEIQALRAQGVAINNLGSINQDELVARTNVVADEISALRSDLAILRAQSKESSDGAVAMIAELFGGLVKFISEFFGRTIIRVQPTVEHYSTPQTVIVLDPYTGKPLDWQSLSRERPRSGGGFSAVSVPGSSPVVSVSVNGTIDGVNTAFTLASTPATGVLYVSLGRQEQVEGVDFTRSGDTITYNTAPDVSLSGFPHRAIIY